MKAHISFDIYIDDNALASWNGQRFAWNCGLGLKDSEAIAEVSHNNYLNTLMEDIEDHIIDDATVFHSECTVLEGDPLLGLNEVNDGTDTK